MIDLCILRASTEGENITASLSVLYIDDDPDLLDIGKLFLEQNGEFTVTTCACPLEASEILARKHVDAIVSDYLMPGMDGVRLLQRLWQHGTTTPFIMFTGKGCEEVAIDALNSGADFYVRKEGNPKQQFAEIGEKIRCEVSGRRAEEALKKNEELYQWLSWNAPPEIVENLNEVFYILGELPRACWAWLPASSSLY